MCFDGDIDDIDVQNIVIVTILEHLSDYDIIWHNFRSYISFEFLNIINYEIAPESICIPRI